MPNDAALNPESPRILIVDDEVAQMTALCNTLHDQGYATTGFASAKAALAILSEKHFDLVLTDLMMPEMDGINFLREAIKTDPNMIGVLMTGEGTIATAVQAMQAGALDYILKPFKLSAILPVLERALSVRRLRIKNAELEQRVHQRTVQLEAANKELEAFSYSVSHDLRSPLRHITGFTRMLAENHAAELSEEARDLLDRVVVSAGRMGQLIDDLLSLSRLGRQHLSSGPVKMSDLVEDVVKELCKDHGDRAVEVRVDNLPECVGDWSLLKQVYVNLLSNAYKFTRNKQDALIEVGCREEAGVNVYFVRDNGAGFDMENAKKLFGVFQRLHSHDEFEGTGVGLSIVQRIIHRHDGRVWAEAEHGKGATFYFTIPASNATDTPD